MFRTGPFFVGFPASVFVELCSCFLVCVFVVLVVQGESSVLYRETPLFVSGSRGVVRALPRNTLVCLFVGVFGCVLCPRILFVNFFWRRVLVEFWWSCVA